MYEILKESTGLKFCAFNGMAAVGRDPEDRKKFERIFQKRNIEYYQCPYCLYTVIGSKYDILFKDINELEETKHGLYFNLLDGDSVIVSKQNFAITCILNECKCPEAWVKPYEPRSPKKEFN